jgi:Skp family chaperone for outer membrane proteins
MRNAIPLLFIALFTSLALPAGAEAQVKVGVVRPAKIFQDMQETKELRARIEQEEAGVKKTGEDKAANIRKLEGELSQLRRDSASFNEKSLQLRNAKIEAESWGKMTGMDIENAQKAQTLELFKKIQAAIAEVAKGKGVDLVLADVAGDLPENVDNINKQQFTQFLGQKNVWYTSDAADLTNDVLAKLDADFKTAAK